MDAKNHRENDPQELLRGALIKIKDLKAALKQARSQASEPIAIVGMSCRFPGGGDGLDAFFDSLLAGTDGVRRIPSERWLPGASHVDRPELRWAGLLDAVDGFDASYFGIAPREAVLMDPQQRLLLEVVSEALEHAGVGESQLMGSKTGVFVGMCNTDYEHLVRRSRTSDAYRATGTMLSTAAGRIAYVLGLQGPCMTVDTACSSSLVGVHLAVQSLRRGECGLALAGGVNVILDSTTMTMLAQTQALSPDGRCKTFDSRANGFVRGEGCGIVALKRLADANRDGDAVLAVIRGSAVNQDGRSMGMTAPSVLAQQAMLQQALDDARVSAKQVGYVETHGTGTSLGDPIEIEALREVLGAPRADGSRCVLGALKSNIGHLEAAAGVAGLIKAVLCLVHGVIPKNLHFQALNPRISLEDTPFVIPTERTPWERGDAPRLAGVSSFGLSGTNAHVVLEEGPVAPPQERMAAPAPVEQLLVLSAKSAAALTTLAGAYRERIAASGADERLDDIARCAALRRNHHEYRLAVVGATKVEVVGALEAHLRGEATPELVHGTSRATPPPIVFVFAGQGSQWAGMGTELFEADPVFREALMACDAAFAPHTGGSVLEELRRPEASSRLAETRVAQPALFSIEVALAASLRALGVTPSAVMGHSIGEVAAAHVAGILELDQAARLVALRAGIMQKASGRGRMISVELSETLAARAIAGLEGRVGIAAINGPQQIVLSGETADVEALHARLVADGVEVRELRVDYAFHSPQMTAPSAELVAVLGKLAPKAGAVSMLSTVTGELIHGEQLDAKYWGDNVRRTVRLTDAVARAARDSRCVFLEVGPHPVLSSGIGQTLAEHQLKGQVLHTLRRQRPERRQLLTALANLHTDGSAVDWTRLYAERGPMVALPQHPWERKRFWLDVGKASMDSGTRRSSTRGTAHPLLGPLLVGSPTHPEEHSWESLPSADALPYLTDHRLGEAIVFPAAAYVEMALAAGAATLGAGELALEDITFERMLVIDEAEDCVVQVVLTEQGAGRCRTRITSLDEDTSAWVTHVTGTVCRPAAAERPVQPPERPASLAARLGAPTSAETHRQRMRERALNYGPAFQGLVELWAREGEAVGRVVLPEGTSPEGYVLHPALLDACLQVATPLLAASSAAETAVPVGIGRLIVRRRPARRAWVVATRRSPADAVDDDLLCDLRLVDDEGESLVELEGFRVRLLSSPAREQTGDELDRSVLEIAWRRLEPLPEPQLPAGGAWLLLMDREGTGAALAARLTALGQRCICAAASPPLEPDGLDLRRFELARPDDYARLVREAFAGAERPQGVIHLLSLDATPPAASTPQTLEHDLLAGSISTAYLTQALVQLAEPPRLFVVTRGAQAVVEGEPISIAQAPVLGLGKTIALEHPEVRCTRIDLGRGADAGELEALVHELAASGREDQLALRSDGRHGARLVRGAFQPPAQLAPAIHGAASYLVTGGLGGLGLALAGWLVDQGARHLVLVGRSEPSPQARTALLAMTAAGAEVRVERVDVSIPSAVAGLFASLRGSMPPLRGVFHAAGVLDDHTLLGQSEQSFRRAFAAKAIGAWNLHVASASHTLDYFVMYSSAASLLGSPGQANYAAANAFLDALARERKRRLLPGLSVQWGAFSEVGMAVVANVRGERLAAGGIASMTPAAGLRALQRLLGGARAQLGIVAFDAEAWASRQPAADGLPFLAELRAHGTETETGDTRDADAEWMEIAMLPKSEAASVILTRLARVLHGVLRLDTTGEAADLERLADTRFSALGVDSLMATELRNQIRRWADVDIPATMMIGGSRISEVVELVHQKVLVRSLALAPDPAFEGAQEDAEVFVL